MDRVVQDGVQRVCTKSGDKPPAELAKSLEADQIHLVRLERLGELGGRLVAAFRAHALHAVLHHAVHGRLAAGMEVALQHFGDILGECRRSDKGQAVKNPGFHRLVPGPWYGSPLPVAVRNSVSATVESDAKFGSGMRICR